MTERKTVLIQGSQFFDSDGSAAGGLPRDFVTHTHTHTTSPGSDRTQYALDVDDRLDHPAHYHGPPYVGCHL
jgi:hypothetical protein